MSPWVRALLSLLFDSLVFLYFTQTNTKKKADKMRMMRITMATATTTPTMTAVSTPAGPGGGGGERDVQGHTSDTGQITGEGVKIDCSMQASRHKHTQQCPNPCTAMLTHAYHEQQMLPSCLLTFHSHSQPSLRLATTSVKVCVVVTPVSRPVGSTWASVGCRD